VQGKGHIQEGKGRKADKGRRKAGRKGSLKQVLENRSEGGFRGKSQGRKKERRGSLALKRPQPTKIPGSNRKEREGPTTEKDLTGRIQDLRGETITGEESDLCGPTHRKSQGSRRGDGTER